MKLNFISFLKSRKHKLYKQTEILCPFPMLQDEKVIVFDINDDIVNFEDKIKVDEVLNFQCPQGFNLVGSEFAICNKFGSIDYDKDELPHCEG